MLTTTGVDCWGFNGDGELGNGTTTSENYAVAVSGLTGATQVASGQYFSCALLSAGTVKCWGDNSSGELGNGTTTSSSSPVAVSGLSGVIQITGASFQMCALLTGGTVKCWGANGSGQLGNGTTTSSSTPVAVSGLSGVTQVSNGDEDTCALLSSGSVKCWGDNSDGQLGNGTTTQSSTPVAVTGLSGATEVSAGNTVSCALLSSGSVKCWGNGGALGNGGTTNSSTPVAVSGLTGATSVSAGGIFVCASGTTAECWGGNYYGQLGDGTTTSSTTPQPISPFTPFAATTTYAFTTGQLTSTTDANGKTTKYLYGYTGEVACETYPVSTTTSCGTLGSPATGSSTNTIVNYSYDASGRLHTVSDWLGNMTTYAYTTAQAPYSATTITYPVTGGLAATYGFDNNGAVTSLSAGSSVSDSWTHNSDEQVSVSTVNGATSASATYNGNHQITGAANLATSTSNDTYTVAANGEIAKDVPPSGTTYSYGYNLGAELCTTTAGSSATACGTNPNTGTSYLYTLNGQRSSASNFTSGNPGTTTNYGWNSLGELCNTSPVTVNCGVTPTNGSNYTYSGDGLRVTTATSTTTGPPSAMLTTTSTKYSTWDLVRGGSIPLNINDATLSSSSPGATANTSYIYGLLLFGGTAPVEQISGSNASFLVANQTGVQAVVGSTGVMQEKAIYSVYGNQSVQSGSKVTPFGFQGSYTDTTGLIYLVNRYYDPSTDQFLSIDPAVANTNQPYVYTDDNPLNVEDPLGLGANSALTKLNKALDTLAAAYKQYEKNPNLRTSAAFASAKKSFEKDAVAANTAVTQSVNAATNTGETQVPSVVATAQSQQAQVQACYNSAVALAAEGGIMGAVTTVGGVVPEFLASFGIEVATGGIGLIFVGLGILIIATTSGVSVYEASQC